ncbi:MAG: hypothetical protein QME51_02095 [Planctomycetota bacterium]|nr:hypothetical protein [Planctomycetota bacterium]MDI6787144.1 hypothetical protein [Planctomycetota bacterium]
MVEKVLVVSRDKLLSGEIIPNGFQQDNLNTLIANIHHFAYFINRTDAENDPSLKQIIPYLVISYTNNLSKVCKIFLVQRLSGQAEKRLHHKYSIGIGGHINPVESVSAIVDIIKNGLERELHEELKVNTKYQYRIVGYINDDTVPVGQVHLGLVYEVIVDDINGIEVAEKELMVGRFATVQEIETCLSSMETWSQIVYSDFINPVRSKSP